MHIDKHVPAWFDGMPYQIQPLAVILEINAWWHQYRPNALDCVMAQAVWLRGCVQ